MGADIDKSPVVPAKAGSQEISIGAIALIPRLRWGDE
jgi:hypothetical protein